MDRQRSALWFVVLTGLGLASGCGLLNNEPMIDVSTDKNGVRTVLDTPRMWKDWREGVDRGIAEELAGEMPGGGIPTWNDQWIRTIHLNRSRENSQRYINYIIESRRAAGLPELVGEHEGGP